MKAKKVAILLVSTSLAMGTLGAMTVFADPPATGSEMPGGNAPQMQDRQDVWIVWENYIFIFP